MVEIKKKFARNLGEATEYSGKKMSYNEVADVLNSAGFKTSRGTDYKGGRGTAHFLKEAAVQLHEDGDDEGCEMVRQITSHNGYYSDVQEEENEDDHWDEEDDDWDDPSTYAHCGDWEDEPENCAFCADDDCPLNRS